MVACQQSGWHTERDSCYFIGDQELQQTQAGITVERVCGTRGLSLAIINDKQEHIFLAGLL